MTTPNYNQNVPTPNMNFADWQTNFISNFQQLAIAFAKNHVALDATSNNGNHTILELFEQSQAQQTNVGEFSMYVKNVEGQTDQVFMRNQGNGIEYQFSNYQIYPLTPTPTQTSYFTFLPGGIIVYFGRFYPGPPNTTLPFPFPGGSLDLSPHILKNIISVNFCPLGTTPEYSPKVTIPPPQNGYYESILVTGAFFVNVEPQYYIVMGNI